MSVLLDASAALALLMKEPGYEQVLGNLTDASISSVNMAEVCAKYSDRMLNPALIARYFSNLSIAVIPFQPQHALVSGQLRPVTRTHGLSLGDRACLATALVEKRTVLTADRVWASLGLDIEVILIR